VPKIIEAADLVEMADIFAVIGTSLAVYPAAGLLDYVPPKVPIFVIDKKLPEISAGERVHLIEKPATEGVKDFRQALAALK
jgi:NAD-dependent deacetylase